MIKCVLVNSHLQQYHLVNVPHTSLVFSLWWQQAGPRACARWGHRPPAESPPRPPRPSAEPKLGVSFHKHLVGPPPDLFQRSNLNSLSAMMRIEISMVIQLEFVR